MVYLEIPNQIPNHVMQKNNSYLLFFSMSAIEMTNETLDIQELFGIIVGHYKNAVWLQ